MIQARILVRTLGVAVVATALAGCISLFPKQEPANLFRFGYTASGPPATGAPSFAVMNAVTNFDRAAASDRILTSSGNSAAYIKGSRWVTMAPALFDEALLKAFQTGGAARLISRGEVVRADYVMKLDVTTFEARYDHGADAAPTVVVTIHAALGRTGDRTLMGERTFEATAPASDNRVGAIAAAFDQAVTKDLTDLVTWVNARGG